MSKPKAEKSLGDMKEFRPILRYDLLDLNENIFCEICLDRSNFPDIFQVYFFDNV